MKLKIHLCIGGTSITTDKKALKEGCHIVVGTPGRVKDMMNRSFLDTNHLKVLVIDEADEMLSYGFLE